MKTPMPLPAIMLATAILAATASQAATVPTDNPVKTRYTDAPGAVPDWVNAMPWAKTVNINDFPHDGKFYDASVAAAQASIVKTGGGVIYFPPGIYPFRDSILLANGVILRGAPPSGASKALDDTYSLESRFEFPKYLPSMEGSGTPIDTAFRFIGTADPTASANCGVAHLAINRAHIYFNEDAKHATAGNRFVFGCVLTNTAAADPSFPNTEFHQAPHQRYTNRHRAAIHVYSSQNLFVANNRIPRSGNDNFIVKPYTMVKVRGNGQDFRINSGKPFDFITVDEGVEFDYDNRPGIYANLTGLGAFGGGGQKGTPETHPNGFRKGTVIRDNYIYCSGRSAITFTGDGVYCAFNTIRFPQQVRRPTTTGLVASDGSATNDNRAITMRGYRWHAQGNDYEVHSNLAFDGKTKINDGEGIMHESHENSMVLDSKMTDNTGNRYLCLWVTPINGLLIRNNKITADGAAIHVLGRDCAVHNLHIENNELTKGNITVSTAEAQNILINGNRYTGNGQGSILLDDPSWANNNTNFHASKPAPKKK